MKFRDLFILVCVTLLTSGGILYGWSRFEKVLFADREINRNDVKRESTVLLSTDYWVEFQIATGSSNFRLLTNAALATEDAPDCDLTHPRIGWRYGIEYELLDRDRRMIEKSEYHFRSEIRQVRDQDSGNTVYPLFFGKRSWAATQTRAMQIALSGQNQDVAIIKVRLCSFDPEIRQVVARALGRVQREDFDQRKTWNRMSQDRREQISRYCVYTDDLLSIAERNNLMRWRWTRCPTLGEFEQRYLFFIDDIDDQEIRDEQFAYGMYVDSQDLATIPLPEGEARVRLEILRVDEIPESSFLDVNWQGPEAVRKLLPRFSLDRENSSFELDANGGMLEIRSSCRVVVRAFWIPIDRLAQQVASDWQNHNQFLINESDEELEITPRRALIQTFLADQRPVDFKITHLDHESTPFRLQLRFPLGPFFQNEELLDNSNSNQTNSRTCRCTWEMVDVDGTVLETGKLEFVPQVSEFDLLKLNGTDERVCEPQGFYFDIPAAIACLRIRSESCRMLINGAVRPNGLAQVFRVPEDYHPFNRIQSASPSWFGLKPAHHLELIRGNRSFNVAIQMRPAEIDERIANGDYDWERFVPQGDWIGRQLLVPQIVEAELKVRQQAIDSTCFELKPAQDYAYRSFETGIAAQQWQAKNRPQLIFTSQQPPGEFAIYIDGQTKLESKLISSRGEVNLDSIEFPPTARIRIQSEKPARFFLSGLDVDAAERFLKRTAQRLDHGQLQFRYQKSTGGEELLTLRLYRHQSANQRCKLSVSILCPDSLAKGFSGPRTSWTIKDRVYDLRPLNETPSLVFGNAGQVDVGHKCFIRFGEDLPPGEYTIRVQCLDDQTDGLVLLYQTTAGQLPVRKLSIGQMPKATKP